MQKAIFQSLYLLTILRAATPPTPIDCDLVPSMLLSGVPLGVPEVKGAALSTGVKLAPVVLDAR